MAKFITKMAVRTNNKDECYKHWLLKAEKRTLRFITGNLQRQKIRSLIKWDFSEYARSIRISDLWKNRQRQAETARLHNNEQSGWSTILDIGNDCLYLEINNVNLFIFSRTSKTM